MCGRFIQCTVGEPLAERFQAAPAPGLAATPRYNVAPTQPVWAVRPTATGGDRELVQLHWGLIPAWAREPRLTYSTINARAETVAEKPAFRHAFRHRRCLIPADGFYEWRRNAARKQPYCIAPADGRPLAFAGLWERWERDGHIIESCTILITQANELIAPIHDRMPVILDPADQDRWLDPAMIDPAALRPLLVPCPATWLRVWPVGSGVNNPRHEGPALWEPLAAPAN